MLKYRKASFPKSVSTAFVTHCSFTRLRYVILTSLVAWDVLQSVKTIRSS